MHVYWISKHILNINTAWFLVLHILHHLIGKRFRKKATGLPASAQFTKLSMWITTLKPSTGCTERSAPGRSAPWKAIRMQLSHTYRADMQLCCNHGNFHKRSDNCGKKWNKPQLSYQSAQKISLFVDDPSTTCWRKSQGDLPPLCLHNRGHKGENVASYITSSQIPFFNYYYSLSYYSWQSPSLDSAIHLLIYTAIIYLVVDWIYCN